MSWHHRTLLAACAVVALALTAQSAAAHPIDTGYLRVDAVAGGYAIALDLDVELAGRFLGSARRLDADDLARGAEALAEATYRRAAIATDEGACQWTAGEVTLDGRTASLTARAACPAGVTAARWALPFVRDPLVPSTFQLLARAGADGVTIVERGAPVLELGGPGGDAPDLRFSAFVASGVAHIGAAPSEWREGLPDGIDHILFVLALVLAGGTLAQLAGTITGFTLGHSITLAIAALGIVRPPAGLIEPLIALTIVATAATSLARGGRPSPHRWKIALAFGLIHGFAFANALAGLELSGPRTVVALFGYNLGVELGQLVILVAILPLLLWLERHPKLRALAIPCAAAAIALAGTYWFLQRI
ncbi:MAG: HupE/UreJ family protein [Deltaproteobacteria bacterium]|nr:HupE/UreJ family protein [Deltaproteobacteria bacterium]